MSAVAMGAGILPSPSGGPRDVSAQGDDPGGNFEPDGSPSNTPGTFTPAPPTPIPSQPQDRPSAPPSRGRSTPPPDAPTVPDPTATPQSPDPDPPDYSKTPAYPDTPGDDKPETPKHPQKPETELPKPQVPDPKKPLPADPVAAAQAAVIELVNQERADAGCKPVRPAKRLTELAADFSEDMGLRGFFDLINPDGLSPDDRAQKAGIRNLGAENIAHGPRDAQSVMDAWMDSPGHRRNILNCDYKTIGVGVNFDDDGPWWTQDFGF